MLSNKRFVDLMKSCVCARSRVLELCESLLRTAWVSVECSGILLIVSSGTLYRPIILLRHSRDIDDDFWGGKSRCGDKLNT